MAPLVETSVPASVTGGGGFFFFFTCFAALNQLTSFTDLHPGGASAWQRSPSRLCAGNAAVSWASCHPGWRMRVQPPVFLKPFKKIWMCEKPHFHLKPHFLAKFFSLTISCIFAGTDWPWCWHQHLSRLVDQRHSVSATLVPETQRYWVFHAGGINQIKRFLRLTWPLTNQKDPNWI